MLYRCFSDLTPTTTTKHTLKISNQMFLCNLFRNDVESDFPTNEKRNYYDAYLLDRTQNLKDDVT